MSFDGDSARVPCNHRRVPHIRLIDPEDADGLLKEEYDAAVERAGKVFNIVKAMSPNPQVLRDSMRLYRSIMFEQSPLTRQDRELLATVVSTRTAATTERSRTSTTSVTRAPTTRSWSMRSTTTPGGARSGGPALCDFAIKLTRAPSAMTAPDADELRSHGWDDVAIHDTIQVVSYFNYINRVADAVGIDDEPDWGSRPRKGRGLPRPRLRSLTLAERQPAPSCRRSAAAPAGGAGP